MYNIIIYIAKMVKSLINIYNYVITCNIIIWTYRYHYSWGKRSELLLSQLDEWTNRPIFRLEWVERDCALLQIQMDQTGNRTSIRKGWSVMTYCRVCCTLAIDNMNSIDSEGREEKCRRMNERDCEAGVRKTAEARERQG